MATTVRRPTRAWYILTHPTERYSYISCMCVLHLTSSDFLQHPILGVLPPNVRWRLWLQSVGEIQFQHVNIWKVIWCLFVSFGLDQLVIFLLTVQLRFVGKNLACGWRNFKFLFMTNVEKSEIFFIIKHTKDRSKPLLLRMCARGKFLQPQYHTWNIKEPQYNAHKKSEKTLLCSRLQRPKAG